MKLELIKVNSKRESRVFNALLLTILLFIKISEASSLGEEQRSKLINRFLERNFDESLIGPHHGGVVNRKSVKIRHILRTEEKVQMDVVYTHDQYGRRKTINHNPENRSKHAIFLGCSMTHGTYVNDEETLPSKFASHAKDFMTYNYAMGGAGIHQMLQLIQKEDFAEDIKEKKGFVFYNYLSSHLGRANGFVVDLFFGGQIPVFEDKDNQVKYVGLMKDISPNKVKFHSWLANLMRRYSHYFNFPPTMWFHHNYFCSLLKGVKQELSRKLPKSKLSLIAADDELGHELLSCLETLKIPYINLLDHDYDIAFPRQPIFKYDSHPTAEYNEFLAKILAKKISEFK